VITVKKKKSSQELLLEKLFSSRVRIRLLTIFILHPDEQHHIRALETEVDAQYSAVWKELKNLELIGLLESELSAGRKLYRLNTEFPLIVELRGILLKTVGVGDLIQQFLNQVGGIEESFIFGSFAEGEPNAESDLDLMIIGQVDLSELSPMIVQMENRLGREVNYIVYTSNEWQSRLENKDPFATNVYNSPKIILIRSNDGV
jgi:predicted nucleotidyltransferase